MFFFFQAEDGIRDLVRSRGLGDVYKRQDGVPLERVFRIVNEQSRLFVESPAVQSLRQGCILSLIHI